MLYHAVSIYIYMQCISDHLWGHQDHLSGHTTKCQMSVDCVDLAVLAVLGSQGV